MTARAASVPLSPAAVTSRAERDLRREPHAGEATLLHRERDQGPVLHDLTVDLAGDRRHALARGAAARRDVAEVGEERVDDRGDELVAATDVPVDRGVRDTELGRELAHRQRIDATGLDDRRARR